MTSILEGAAYLFTFIGAMAGVGYLLANRPLKRMIEAETVQAKRESEEKIADLNMKAAALGADAEKSREGVAQAQADAAKARESLASAEQQAAEANAKAEGFRLDIAKANEGAARANETAERERLARLQLEARLADRTMTSSQKTAFIAQLATARGTTVDALTFGDTPEIQIISGMILESLRTAGWVVNPAQSVGGGTAVRGILVGTRTGSDAATVRAANLLISALQAAGLASGPWDFEKLQQPSLMSNSGYTGTAPIRLFIGSKP